MGEAKQTENLPDVKVDVVKEEDDKKIKTKQKLEKSTEIKEEKPMLKKVIKPKEKDVKTEEEKKKDENEKMPFGAKLRKTETVKREIKEAKLETVQLKHHQFEVTPKDTDLEQTTGIILGEPLVSSEEGGNVMKKTD